LFYHNAGRILLLEGAPKKEHDITIILDDEYRMPIQALIKLDKITLLPKDTRAMKKEI
jgi:hypothetical protein